MDTEIRPSRTFARAAITAAVVVLAVVGAGMVLTAQEGWTAAEMGFLRRINLAHTAPLDSVAMGINWFFGPAVAPFLVLVGCGAVLLLGRSPRTALQFLVIVTIPWMGNEVVKALVGRPRPDIASLPHILVLEPGGLSFPSGHTSFAACLLLGLVITVRGRRWRPPLVAATVVIVLATAASRVYLGVHYPSDVAGSIGYSVAAVALVNAMWMLLVPHLKRRRPGTSAVPAARSFT